MDYWSMDYWQAVEQACRLAREHRTTVFVVRWGDLPYYFATSSPLQGDKVMLGIHHA